MVGLWTKADAASSFDNIVVKKAEATAEDAGGKPGQTPPKPDGDEDEDEDEDDDQPAPKNP